MATALQLITDAWNDSNVGGIPATLTSGDRDNYLRRLNRMLDSWSADGLMVYVLYRDTLTTSIGVESYATSVLASTERPTWIDHAYITADGVDHMLRIISPLEYDGIASKTSRGLPSMLNYQANMTTGHGKIILYPVPDAAYTLTVVVPRKFTAYAYTDTVSLPPGYEKAIVDNLTVEIAAANNVNPTPLMMQRAMESKAVIQRNSVAMQIETLDTDIGIGSHRSNIETDA